MNIFVLIFRIFEWLLSTLFDASRFQLIAALGRLFFRLVDSASGFVNLIKR